ncbi:MAG: hypothetical protein U1F54_22125 [Burkholderiales bacterium]
MLVLLTTIGSPFFAGSVTGTIWRRNVHGDRCRGLSWLRIAKASGRRARWNSARRSRGLDVEVDAVLRLHERIDEAPADVSSIWPRATRCRLRGHDERRVVSSTPRSAVSTSPVLMARAAVAAASRLEPHRRWR